MPVNQPVFILVRPQLGENIGASARAMANFGQTKLRLVSPRDSWPNRAADDTSTGAFEEMETVQVFNTIQEAAADLHYLYAVTARPRGMAKDSFTPQEAVKNMDEKTGFVFGPERTGLENNEAALCHAVLTIPSNPVFPVLNLAQSVSLISWEIFKMSDQTAGRAENRETAPNEIFEAMFTRLQAELEESNYFKGEHIKPTMLRNIRTMFLRGEWTEQEICTFHGILSALTQKKKWPPLP